jgi:hypothetical protein
MLTTLLGTSNWGQHCNTFYEQHLYPLELHPAQIVRLALASGKYSFSHSWVSPGMLSSARPRDPRAPHYRLLKNLLLFLRCVRSCRSMRAPAGTSRSAGTMHAARRRLPLLSLSERARCDSQVSAKAWTRFVRPACSRCIARCALGPISTYATCTRYCTTPPIAECDAGGDVAWTARSRQYDTEHARVTE